MRDITYICAFFENQGMLIEQQKIWASFTPDLRKHLHTIVTDDLSPHSPAREVFQSADIASQRLYLALVHRRWDWLFCRNLGAKYATTDWVLLTDIDHALTQPTLQQLVTMDLDPENVYRLRRVDAPRPMPYRVSDCTPYKDHPNTWLMTKAMFWEKVGGYDEAFSGYYGSDSEFRERVQRAARAVVMLPESMPMVRYPREIIPDASTTTYQRKEKQDGKNVPRIKAEIAADLRRNP